MTNITKRVNIGKALVSNRIRNIAMNLNRLATFVCFAAPVVAFADCPPCGPGYCLDTKEYQKALADKKAAARQSNYPERLVAIYDRIDRCQLCIQNAPDGFSIMRIGMEGSIKIDSWDATNERIDAKAVKDGSLRAC